MPLYLESNRFHVDSTSSSSSSSSSYRLVLGLTYPFECYEFETSEERDAALIDELDYLARFMSRSAWRGGGGGGGENGCVNPSTQGEHLEQERRENGIDEHQLPRVHLVELARLLEFDSIQKFKLESSCDQIAEVVRRLGHKHGLRLTKSGLYIIHETCPLDNHHHHTSDDEHDERESSRSGNEDSSGENVYLLDELTFLF